MVVNEAPLNSILNNPEATGRVALWGIELSPLGPVGHRAVTPRHHLREATRNQISSPSGFPGALDGAAAA